MALLSLRTVPFALAALAIGISGCGGSGDDSLFGASAPGAGGATGTGGGSTGKGGGATAGSSAAGSTSNGGTSAAGNTSKGGTSNGGSGTAGKGGTGVGAGGKGVGAGGTGVGAGGTGVGAGGTGVGPGGAAGKGGGPGGAGGMGKGGAAGKGGSAGKGGGVGKGGAAGSTTGTGGTGTGGATVGTGGSTVGTGGTDVGTGGAVGTGGTDVGTGGAVGTGGTDVGTGGMGGSTVGTGGSGGAGGTDIGTGGAGGSTAGAGGSAAGAAGSGGVAGDTCPGIDEAVDPGVDVVITGDTTGATNDTNSNAAQCGGSNSPDLVYAVTPSADGVLTAQVSAAFTASLYARAGCTDNNAITCSGGAQDEKISFAVSAGKTYFVFVDGYGTSAVQGAFTLTLHLGVCGDGVVDSGEDCDDHNTMDGDGCTKECKFDNACQVDEKEPNGITAAQQFPDVCLTAVFGNAALNPSTDEDWVCEKANDGETITASTFYNNPFTCGGPSPNSVIEIFAGTPGTDPANTSCTGSTALACDDAGGLGGCSLVSYLVPAGGAGTYCIRVMEHGKSGLPVFGYSMYVIRR